MAGIEERIKELIGRTDSQPLGLYTSVDTLVPEDNGEDGTPTSVSLDAGTIHLVDASNDSDGLDLELPEPSPSSRLISVKLISPEDGSLQSPVTLVTPDDGQINGSSSLEVPNAVHSLVEVVSDGDDYHVLNTVDETV